MASRWIAPSSNLRSRLCGHALPIPWLFLLALSPEGQAQEIEKAIPLDDRLVIELVAREPEINTPTGMTVDRRGRVWAIESNTHFPPKGYKGKPTDRILIFDDYGPDGRARKVTTFADGFRYGMSIEIAKNGDVYFATRWEVAILRDTNGDDVVDEKKVIVKLDTKGDYPHNGLCGFAFDAEGCLFFGMGENLGADYKLIGSDGTTLAGGGEGGNVYRCRPDGSGLVRIATGFWNPFHMCYDAFGRLFIVDNDPDSRPPCRLLHVVPGGDFGFKYRIGRKGLHPFQAWNGELPGTLPMVAGTAEAPSGIVAYESDGLPEDYRGTLIATSWGDHVIQRFRLVPKGASFTSQPENIVRGGEFFRPVGMAVAPDGSLFLTDWVDKEYHLHGKGRVWRVRAKTPPPKPSDAEHALEFLSHPRRDLREQAGASFAKNNPKVLERILQRDSNPRARIQALWSANLIEPALSDKAEEVRGEAVRMLAGNEARKLHIATTDPSKFVRMQAVLGLREKASLPAILPLLADEDPFLVSAVIETLGRAADAALLLEYAEAKHSKVRLGILLAMRRQGHRDCRAAIPRFLEAQDPAIRRAAIQWVGEEGLKDYVPAMEAAASRVPVTREIFEAFIAAADFLNEGLRREGDQRGGDFYLVKMLNDTGQPLALRTLALRMLRPDHPVLTVAKLKEFLACPDRQLRIDAIRVLVYRADEAAQQVLREAMGDTVLRPEAIPGLTHSASASEKTRELLRSALEKDPLESKMDAVRSLGGTVNDPVVRRALLQLRANGGELGEKAALVLGQAGEKRPSEAEWAKIAADPGDPSAGEHVFFHPKGPQCYVCHRVNGRGGIVGPDLSTIGQTFDRAKLVESILQPSKEVAPMFVHWRVRTRKGDVVDGRLLQEDPSPTGYVLLINAQGQQTKVLNVDIEERQASKISIMPEKLTDLLTRNEFRDLVAYLAGLK